MSLSGRPLFHRTLQKCGSRAVLVITSVRGLATAYSHRLREYEPWTPEHLPRGTLDYLLNGTRLDGVNGNAQSARVNLPDLPVRICEDTQRSPLIERANSVLLIDSGSFEEAKQTGSRIRIPGMVGHRCHVGMRRAVDPPWIGGPICLH